MSGPLQGVRVLDLTRLLPGAFATALLGDLGADVIKVEQPGVGDPTRAYEPRLGVSSAYHWVLDRNKRSIALDLRDARGVRVVAELAAGCAVLVESFRPGVADKLGVGYEAMRAVNPALVYCSLSGFGADGPLAGQAAHDINYAGRAGLIGLGGVDGVPAIPGTQPADLGGSLIGLAGLLAALVAAERSGHGDHVDVALADSAFALLATALAPHFATGAVPGTGSELLTGGYPCYQLYRCADGRMLTVGALESRFWHALCLAVGRPELEPTQFDPAAIPRWRELFAQRTLAAWLELLDGVDACTGPVNDLAQAVADPQLQARAMVVGLADHEGTIRPQLGTAIKLRERPGAIRAAAPALGADTRELLGEAGYDEARIDELLAAGVATVHEQVAA